MLFGGGGGSANGTGSESFRTDSSSPACASLSPPAKDESMEGHTSEEGERDRDRICSPSRSPETPGFRRKWNFSLLFILKRAFLNGILVNTFNFLLVFYRKDDNKNILELLTFFFRFVALKRTKNSSFSEESNKVKTFYGDKRLCFLFATDLCVWSDILVCPFNIS